MDFLRGLKEHRWDDDHYHGQGFMSADFSKINIPAMVSVSQSKVIHGLLVLKPSESYGRLLNACWFGMHSICHP
jgi:hypothetical protein